MAVVFTGTGADQRGEGTILASAPASEVTSFRERAEPGQAASRESRADRRPESRRGGDIANIHARARRDDVTLRSSLAIESGHAPPRVHRSSLATHLRESAIEFGHAPPRPSSLAMHLRGPSSLAMHLRESPSSLAMHLRESAGASLAMHLTRCQASSSVTTCFMTTHFRRGGVDVEIGRGSRRRAWPGRPLAMRAAEHSGPKWRALGVHGPSVARRSHGTSAAARGARCRATPSAPAQLPDVRVARRCYGRWAETAAETGVAPGCSQAISDCSAPCRGTIERDATSSAMIRAAAGRP